MVERESFALRHRHSGRLLTLQFSSNTGLSECNERTVVLGDDGGDQRFETKSVSQLQRVLMANERWYNSDEDSPCWGRLSPDAMEPVRVRRIETFDDRFPQGSTPIHVEETIEPIELRPLVGRPLDAPRAAKPKLLNMYFGLDCAELGSLEIAPVPLQDGEVPADLLNRFVVGRYAFDGRGIEGEIVAIAEANPDYPFRDGPPTISWALALIKTSFAEEVVLHPISRDEGPSPPAP